MVSDPPRADNTGDPPAAPRWRAALLVVVLCVAVLSLVYVTRWLNRKSSASQSCFRDLFAGRTTRALRTFDFYRGLAEDDVPERVTDDFLRLKANKNYPLYTDRLDDYLITRTVFFALASDHALARAKDARHAAILALGYVMQSLQSDGAPAKSRTLPATPLLILARGHARPVESAWVMANLLRIRGIPAAVIRLADPATGKVDYAIIGVLIDKRLYLFDPYRAVPICRAVDGCIADLQTVLSGRDKLAPGFGGPGTPVTLERLRKAYYLVPADASCVLPDAYLLGRIIRENGRHEVVYRPYRADLRNLAAAVFGEGARVNDQQTVIRADGRTEVVGLWEVPFRIDREMAAGSGYFEKLSKAHRAVMVYLNERRLHLFGGRDAAAEVYGHILQKHSEDAEVVEDVSFFQTTAVASAAKRAELLDAYLSKYPEGRWRPLATLLLAELEARHGTAERTLQIVARLKPPYDVRAGLLAQAARDGKKQIGWRYPK